MAGGGSSLESPIPFPKRDPITVFINGNRVRIVGETPDITPDTIGTCLSSPKFKKLLQSIDSEITVTCIVIQSVDMFGPNVGFIKLRPTRPSTAIPSRASSSSAAIPSPSSSS